MRRDLRDTSSAPILNFHRGAFPGSSGRPEAGPRCLAEGRGGDAGGIKLPPRLLSGSRPRFASVSRRAPAGQAGPCLRARRFVLGRRGSAPRPTSVSRGSPTGSRLAGGGSRSPLTRGRHRARPPRSRDVGQTEPRHPTGLSVGSSWLLFFFPPLWSSPPKPGEMGRAGVRARSRGRSPSPAAPQRLG